MPHGHVSLDPRVRYTGQAHVYDSLALQMRPLTDRAIARYRKAGRYGTPTTPRRNAKPKATPAQLAREYLME